MDGDRSRRMHPGPTRQNGCSETSFRSPSLADVALRVAPVDGSALGWKRESALAKRGTGRRRPPPSFPRGRSLGDDDRARLGFGELLPVAGFARSSAHPARPPQRRIPLMTTAGRRKLPLELLRYLARDRLFFGKA